MRGVFAITISILALVASFSVYLMKQEAFLEASRQTQNIISLQEKSQFELTLKHAFSTALNSSGNGKDKIHSASNRLAELEELIESEKVELWFGELSEGEEKSLLSKIAIEKKPLKCLNCFDFSEEAIDFEGNSVRKSVSVLWFDENFVFVSRNGQANAPVKMNGRVGIGASYYANNVSGIMFFSEGFK